MPGSGFGHFHSFHSLCLQNDQRVHEISLGTFNLCAIIPNIEMHYQKKISGMSDLPDLSHAVKQGMKSDLVHDLKYEVGTAHLIHVESVSFE